ncbi:IPT/TIG domain-containing protein [Cellulophaga sp. L1A9]|uniref:IPT/TIG domain-containing protein n=1 Tax=Cellulophaga sp. L1A9 TaxID=2686362 RepID=UPI00131BFAEE|nr:IPT/TIG domain-containing protein [Cellulophaga sp. L1A9]
MKYFSPSILIGILCTLILSCSENEQSTDDSLPEQQIEIAKIQSYSKNFGYTGDIIEINGTNFIEDSDKVSVLFDGTNSEIIALSNTTIKVKLPLVENGIPDLEINMEGRQIDFEVANDYSGNIGILAKIPGKWAFTRTENSFDETIWTSQLVTPERIYYGAIRVNNTTIRSVERSLDGGLTFERWVYQGFTNAFHATPTDEGWAESLKLLKIPAGGSVDGNDEIIFGEIDDVNGGIAAMSVSDDLQNGLFVSGNKKVFQTKDGENFDVIYDPNYEYLTIRTGFRLDDDHFWAGGGNVSYGIKPSLLFTHNGGVTWHDLELDFNESTTVYKIQFLDPNNGYMLTFRDINSPFRLRKTIDGGFTWQTVETLLPNTNFVFLDTSVGYSFLDNIIFKTTDGGVTWNKDIEAEGKIRQIDIKDNIVIAKIENGMLRYFL